MKIAIVSGDDVAGDDPQQLCAALAARGHEPTACVRQRGRRPADAGTRGYRTLSTAVGPRAAASVSDVLPYVGEWAAALESAWSSERPDVVHAYGWLGGLAAQLAARRHRLPTVQSFLGLAARPNSRSGGAKRVAEQERLEPLLARSAAWVTGECAAEVDALARLRRSRARMSVLTGGVDIERYTPMGPALPRTGSHRLLCVAPNPLRRHGFDIVIGALPRVPDTELILAETEATDRDRDGARTWLRRLATELGVANRVRFAGTVGDDELPTMLRSADVVACTPRQPPRATGVLQAMASGVVVVALSVGVLNDAVIDNVTGFLVSPESRGELSAVLRSVVGQPFQCESMGAAGRSRALSRFPWDRIALDSLNIYQQVGAQGGVSSQLQVTTVW